MATIGFFLRFSHAIDSEALWKTIGGRDVNVTDFGDNVWVYGEVSPIRLARIVDCCLCYGNPTAEFFRKEGGHK